MSELMHAVRETEGEMLRRLLAQRDNMLDEKNRENRDLRMHVERQERIMRRMWARLRPRGAEK